MSERRFEWPTYLMLALTYALWAWATTWLAGVFLPAGILLAAVAAAQHSSLSHEALHGHPTRWPLVNEALVFPPLSLFIPYQRFRDTHLAHHNDETLTDPYDDPESNFLDPAVWARLPRWIRAVLRFNNTLLGRLLIGPLVAQIVFMRGDWQQIRAGNRAVRKAWLWHIPALGLVAAWMVAFGQMPLWALLLSAYGALSVLKIRTYLEHRAHVRARGRSVVIEDRGPLALIFLNNNLHAVHHAHPRLAWYALPQRLRENREHYLKRNEGYHFPSYGAVFRRYFWKAKDPVPHPLYPRS